MKNEIRSTAHSKYRCEYHIVFVPKYRRKEIYGQLKRDIGEILRKLDFDIVEDYKKQGVLKRTIKEIFERKIDVLNLYQDQAYQIIRKSNNTI